MKIEQWPLDRPIPYARNARKISDAAITKVAASLKEFGWRQPIVVDAEGVVVVGHSRLLAAKRLGMSKVPVHVATELSPEQVRAYRLMDNRSHEETEWDKELLSLELGELKGLNFDLDLTGFDLNEVDGYLRGVSSPEDFKEFNEDIEVEHQCPKCGYRFSGGTSSPVANSDSGAAAGDLAE